MEKLFTSFTNPIVDAHINYEGIRKQFKASQIEDGNGINCQLTDKAVTQAWHLKRAYKIFIDEATMFYMQLQNSN